MIASRAWLRVLQAKVEVHPLPGATFKTSSSASLLADLGQLVHTSTGTSARCSISGLQADPAVQVLVLRGGSTGETGKSFQDSDHLLGGSATEFLRLRPFRSRSRELAAVGQR